MRRVFIMDDNITNVGLFSDLIRSFGFEVRDCTDSLAAMDIVKEFQPDIAILDIVMPIESGFNVCKQIRAVMGDRPIFAMTALAPEDIRDKMTEAGFTGILRKPCSSQAIYQALGC